MRTNNLMLQSALNRLQHWQDELVMAESAKDAERGQECAKFIQEYGVLIREMMEAAVNEVGPGPQGQDR